MTVGIIFGCALLTAGVAIFTWFAKRKSQDGILVGSLLSAISVVVLIFSLIGPDSTSTPRTVAMSMFFLFGAILVGAGLGHLLYGFFPGAHRPRSNLGHVR